MRVSERDRTDTCIRGLSFISTSEREKKNSQQVSIIIDGINALFPKIIQRMHDGEKKLESIDFSYSILTIITHNQELFVSCSSKLMNETALYSFFYDGSDTETVNFMAVQNPEREDARLLDITTSRANLVLVTVDKLI